MAERAPSGRPVLVTGATGHVGSELVGELLRAGRPVRALSRDDLERAGVEAVRGDVLDRGSLDATLEGVEAAYYLVHA
ncbi:MAG TPA: NmrA family NAD(P)-binding protein, partial [Gaiellaceae bacterium]|nr:NmrA family NAD(P)-binding protein [Gaiellaceae bacterium]